MSSPQNQQQSARKAHNRKLKRTLVLAVLIVAALWALITWTNRPSSPRAAVWSPAVAQPKLPTVKLYLGFAELAAEVARRPTEIMTGMMFRTNLGPNEAMLFLLPVPQQASFYMRNTLIPLSCAYIDDDGVIVEVHDTKPRDETSILSATPNIRFVLEVNRGWFETNHIGPGTLIRTDKGELRRLLRGQW